jgi:hypothetical protein
MRLKRRIFNSAKRLRTARIFCGKGLTMDGIRVLMRY